MAYGTQLESMSSTIGPTNSVCLQAARPLNRRQKWVISLSYVVHICHHFNQANYIILIKQTILLFIISADPNKDSD